MHCTHVEFGKTCDGTWEAEAKSAQPWLLEDSGLACCLAGLDENLCQLSRERSRSGLSWFCTESLYEAKQSQRLLAALFGSCS